MAIAISGVSLPSLFHYKNSIIARKRRIRSFSIRSCKDVSGEGDGGGEPSQKPKRLSEKSSWEAKDSEGKDYLYRLGSEADNMNIAVGARAGVIDDLFAGNFLGRDCKCPIYHCSFLFILWLWFQFCSCFRFRVDFLCSGHCV